MQITHDIIVNTHKGEIKVDTKVGEGTTITFVIPAEGVK
jgi:signal transduction histidine kinase